MEKGKECTLVGRSARHWLLLRQHQPKKKGHHPSSLPALVKVCRLFESSFLFALSGLSWPSALSSAPIVELATSTPPPLPLSPSQTSHGEKPPQLGMLAAGPQQSSQQRSAPPPGLGQMRWMGGRTSSAAQWEEMPLLVPPPTLNLLQCLPPEFVLQSLHRQDVRLTGYDRTPPGSLDHLASTTLHCSPKKKVWLFNLRWMSTCCVVGLL